MIIFISNQFSSGGRSQIGCGLLIQAFFPPA